MAYWSLRLPSLLLLLLALALKIGEPKVLQDLQLGVFDLYQRLHPREYQEAAAVDGAGAWHTFRHVTAPILLPFAAIITVLTANNTLHLFALVQSMTQGGPYYATQVIEVFIYQTGFASENSGGVPQLGYASAAGCLFGLAVMVIALLQLWAVKRGNRLRATLGAR